MAPLYIADRRGYFAEEGLKVEFIDFDSVSNMVAPLGVGQLDAGGGALAAGIYNAVGRGIDVRVVADLASDPPGYGFQELLIRTDLVRSGKYKTFKDLKGLTIAGNTPGSTSSSELNQLLIKAGLKFDDVKRVFMGYPDHIAGLKNGSVDASLMPEPNATTAVKDGVAVKVAGDDAFYPGQQVAVLVYGANLFRAHRDSGLKFMRAFIKAARYYNDALAGGKLAGPNADEVVKILTRRHENQRSGHLPGGDAERHQPRRPRPPRLDAYRLRLLQDAGAHRRQHQGRGRRRRLVRRASRPAARALQAEEILNPS